MSDIIRLLPDSVANQIAAGEVIQRPASVVKELVENAVDAGADEIRIFIRDAGRTLIQVTDNGKGMTETDARMAFERHATSKIQAAADLFSLHTMGFRGEALPSICAISQVELKTRTEDDDIGTQLLINASKVESQEPCVCERGVNIMVKNLFFNVPARRKFLKSDNVELSNIMREFERLALVNNRIHMSIDTGSRVIDLRAGSFKQRIGDIWKNNLNMQLLPVECDTSLVKISGFISRPEFARRRNPLQYLIVNGRNMRHPYFHKAIVSCFEGLIATDTQPCYFIKFEVDPNSIDVNIHPTKNEIKFEYEQQIWPILQASVKASLGRFSAVPSIDFSTDMLPVAPLAEGTHPLTPDLDIPDDYNPFNVKAELPTDGELLTPETDLPPFSTPGGFSTPANGNQNRGGGSTRRVPSSGARNSSNWESLYESFMHGAEKERPAADYQPDTSFRRFAAGLGASINTNDSGSPTPGGGISSETKAPFKEADSLGADARDTSDKALTAGVATEGCFQFGDRYIVTSSREGLIVIDQHRAHVKILYERCLERVHRAEQVSQRVMFPESIELDPEHQAALGSVEEELTRIGFILEYEEGNRWNIAGIPAILHKENPKDILLRILDSVCEDSVNYGKEGSAAESLLSRVALLAARSGAIERARRLTAEEMQSLVNDLFSLPDPARTPNGNPVYCLIDQGRLTSIFD